MTFRLLSRRGGWIITATERRQTIQPVVVALPIHCVWCSVQADAASGTRHSLFHGCFGGYRAGMTVLGHKRRGSVLLRRKSCCRCLHLSWLPQFLRSFSGFRRLPPWFATGGRASATCSTYWLHWQSPVSARLVHNTESVSAIPLPHVSDSVSDRTGRLANLQLREVNRSAWLSLCPSCLQFLAETMPVWGRMPVGRTWGLLRPFSHSVLRCAGRDSGREPVRWAIAAAGR